MFDIIEWQDEELDRDNNVMQVGTLHDQVNMNRMEAGIYENSAVTSELTKEVIHHKKTLSDLEGELGQTKLVNADDFPFNNSTKTIALRKNRDTHNYRVIAEVVESDGEVGEVLITDKLLNGFKIEFNGSAKNVTIKYFVQGGMYQ